MAGTSGESSKAAAELAVALEQFRTLLDPALVDALQPCGPATVYTPWITVWLLVYQRFHANATLETAVAELLKIAVTAGHEVLTRLTQSRFHAMKRSAQPIGPGRWLLCWKPSHWERRVHPHLPVAAQIRVHLHEFVGFSGKTMWIMTTLDISVEVLADLYAKRWGIETDIRQLKRTLQCDALRGRSPETIMKELAMAMVSYNLVIQVRRIAAERVNLPPRRLSFTGVWSLVTKILLSSNDWTADEWLERFEWVLRGAAQRKLPRRPGRSYPREILPRGNKFPKKKRKKVEEATK